MSAVPEIIKFFTTPNGNQVVCCKVNNLIWVSGKEIANALGYKNARSAISTHVSAENRSAFGNLFSQPIKGIPNHKIFLTLKGVEELIAKKQNQPLLCLHSTEQPSLEDWKNVLDSASFLLPSSNSEQAPKKFPGLEPLDEVKTTSFKSLAEIPETVSKPLASHGFIYVLKVSTSTFEGPKTLGKVGKTRSIQNRITSLQSQFKENVELVWFCFCFNIDVVEREILYKLNHMNALVNYQSFTEVFDPQVISFEELLTEIQRLVEVINSQWETSEKKYEVQQKKYEVQLEYLKFINQVAESTKQIATENPEKFQTIVDKLLTGFEKIS